MSFTLLIPWMSSVLGFQQRVRRGPATCEDHSRHLVLSDWPAALIQPPASLWGAPRRARLPSLGPVGFRVLRCHPCTTRPHSLIYRNTEVDGHPKQESTELQGACLAMQSLIDDALSGCVGIQNIMYDSRRLSNLAPYLRLKKIYIWLRCRGRCLLALLCNAAIIFCSPFICYQH